MSSRPAWATKRVPGQLGLQRRKEGRGKKEDGEKEGRGKKEAGEMLVAALAEDQAGSQLLPGASQLFPHSS